MEAAAAGRDWVAALPPELDGQRALLTGLLDACAADERLRWLALGCSVARGAGDELSDLDLGMGVSDYPALVPHVHELVDGLGELVESLVHQLPGRTAEGQPYERIFAQYANGTQVDLVVFPPSIAPRSLPRAVILFQRDPDAAVPAERQEPAAVTPGQVREWAFLGWCALADLTKYLRRGSLWEAYDRLQEARAQLWKLHAAAAGISDPQFGITSLLDFAPKAVPCAMAATVADLDPAALREAARQIAAGLTAGPGLPPAAQAALPGDMARYVTGVLDSLAQDPADDVP